ncbi:MAG: DHHA1 domain-containing protein, partial [Proteobacteria bacterium]|nr:DHHA1 domain-containing protein [Pseudomonadota bacterium]
TVPSADAPHPSYALVNPFRADSTFPFRGMASVGLMFYLAAALRTELRARDWYANRPAPDVREYLDLVALGTIADLVPLTHENRILTSLGLRKLSTRTRPGIAALLASANFDVSKPVDAHCVGWKLGPRLNAPGRLGAAEPSLALLLATEADAVANAEILESMNTERRAIQDKVVAEAVERLEVLGDVPPAIVIAGQGWAPGVVGIVAAKLVDKYQRPAFVIGVDENGLGRGSARSVAGIDLYKALCGSAPHLGRFGGHAAAAGFTLDTTVDGALDALRSSLVHTVGVMAPHFLPAAFAQGSGPVAALPMREADAEVSVLEVDERLAHELEALGPFGQANPAPLLVTRNARVTAVRRVGNDKHLKLVLAEGEGDGPVRHAIGFKLGDRQVEVGQYLDLAFVPTISTFQGRRSAELEILDLAPAVPLS